RALLLRDFARGCRMAARMQLAGRGRIGHLLLKDREALCPRLERRPVRRRAEDGFVLIDDLVGEDSDAAREVPLRIQDGLVGVMRRKVLVGLPVEGAAVSFAVLV